MQIKDNGDIILQRKVDVELLIRLDERTDFICTTMKEIKTDTKDFQKVKTDVSWLKKFFWVLAGGVVGGLITSGLSVWGYFILKNMFKG